jgi:hypothetical protein
MNGALEGVSKGTVEPNRDITPAYSWKAMEDFSHDSQWSGPRFEPSTSPSREFYRYVNLRDVTAQTFGTLFMERVQYRKDNRN